MEFLKKNLEKEFKCWTLVDTPIYSILGEKKINNLAFSVIFWELKSSRHKFSQHPKFPYERTWIFIRNLVNIDKILIYITMHQKHIIRKKFFFDQSSVMGYLYYTYFWLRDTLQYSGQKRWFFFQTLKWLNY